MSLKGYALSLAAILAAAASLWGIVLGFGLSPRLGLDLRGGVSVILAPEARAVAPGGSGSPLASPAASASPLASPAGARATPGASPAAGAAAGGNLAPTVAPSPEAAPALPQGPVPADVIQKTVDILRQRVNALGVTEAEVTTEGGNILVQIPQIQERERALKVIGQVAQLQMRPVLAVIPSSDPSYGSLALTQGEDPASEVVYADKAGTKYRLGPAALAGGDVKTADAILTPGTVNWEVSLTLTSEGARKFQDVTAKLACNPYGDPTRQLAIVLDRVVQSHPQMAQEVKCGEGISGGRATITGSFTQQEAQDLALVLRTGALPVTLRVLQVRSVSPTLGQDSLRAGLLAGAIGLALLALWMLLYYRGLGLVTLVGLGVFGSLAYGLVTVLGKVMGFTLTLAGVAGLIVALGITTDSYIVYYERLKEEVRAGRSFRAAAPTAFWRAFRTTFAADVVSFSAAFVLYLLAVGPVRGFAFTLGLSTLLDLAVLLLYTRSAVVLLSRTPFFVEGPFIGMRAVVVGAGR